MFKLGEMISYPMYGVGRIEAIEEKEIRGKVDTYYVLCFRSEGERVMLPVRRAEAANLRPLIDLETAREVLEFLGTDHNEREFANWNRRYRFHLDKLKSGDIFEVASVFKSLCVRKKSRGLSSGERVMFDSARGFLTDELAAVFGRTSDETMERIMACIEQ